MTIWFQIAALWLVVMTLIIAHDIRQERMSKTQSEPQVECADGKQ